MEMLIRLQTMLQGLIADPRMAQLSFVVLIGLAVFALMVAVLLIYLGLSNPSGDGPRSWSPGIPARGRRQRADPVSRRQAASLRRTHGGAPDAY